MHPFSIESLTSNQPRSNSQQVAIVSSSFHFSPEITGNRQWRHLGGLFGKQRKSALANFSTQDKGPLSSETSEGDGIVNCSRDTSFENLRDEGNLSLAPSSPANSEDSGRGTPPATEHDESSQHQVEPPGSQETNLSKEKPVFSYIALISMAILSSSEKKMVLSDVYQYIMDHYGFYRNDSRAWRNSIRHNLSLNECFIKSGRAENGKGNYWAIHPACEDDFSRGDYRRRQARRRARSHMADPLSALPMAYRYSFGGYLPMGHSTLGNLPFNPYMVPTFPYFQHGFYPTIPGNLAISPATGQPYQIGEPSGRSNQGTATSSVSPSINSLVRHTGLASGRLPNWYSPYPLPPRQASWKGKGENRYV